MNGHVIRFYQLVRKLECLAQMVFTLQDRLNELSVKGLQT